MKAVYWSGELPTGSAPCDFKRVVGAAGSKCDEETYRLCRIAPRLTRLRGEWKRNTNQRDDARNLVLADRSQAAAYPVKPERCIVPFAPGGGADNVARILQAEVSQALGQSLVIDNRPGGSGIIGTEIVANSAPDGYTVLLITTTHAVNASFVRKLPYDSVLDFTFVSLLVTPPESGGRLRLVFSLRCRASTSPGGRPGAAPGGPGFPPARERHVKKRLRCPPKPTAVTIAAPPI